jgi:glycosyltransferase involved in cell wall biosynthesis
VIGQPDIRLSVALVTRNRPQVLERCLRSLNEQSARPFEVIVSDDSDPALSAETEKVARRWQCRYRSGPRRGLYANRNSAAAACSGTHIRTMDDDHTFPAGHLAHCLEAVRSDPNVIWTLGEVSFLGPHARPPAERANQLHASGVGTAVHDPENNWSIADGSTIYPRAIFDAGFRMVETFPYGSSYLEFGAYLYARGYRSRCLRAPLLEHHLEEETLHRGNTAAGIASRIFASLCFNLFFQPNRVHALRYLIGGLRSGGFRLRLMAQVPRLLVQAQARWAYPTS